MMDSLLNGRIALEVGQIDGATEESTFKRVGTVLEKVIVFSGSDGDDFEEADIEIAHLDFVELDCVEIARLGEVEMSDCCLWIPGMDVIEKGGSGIDGFVSAHDAECGRGEDVDAAFFGGRKNAEELKASGGGIFVRDERGAPESDGAERDLTVFRTIEGAEDLDLKFPCLICMGIEGCRATEGMGKSAFNQPVFANDFWLDVVHC